MLARLQAALVFAWLLTLGWGLHWALVQHASLLLGLAVVRLAA